eukprot:scaffold34710_cov208-Amphora_coffeaeformis.AAC.7
MTTESKSVYLLTGDIGGTNSRMSLYDVRHSEPKVVKYYRNAEHLPEERLKDADAFSMHIVVPFLKHCWEQQADDGLVLAPLEETEIVACVATAGVVTDNAAKLTNLGGLLIDGNAIQADTKNAYLKHVKRVFVINDFVAQGYGCLTLKASEVRHLNGPNVKPETLTTGPKVCVGAGTGLGECYMTQTNNQGDYTCYPSEGGHVEYAPRDDTERGARRVGYRARKCVRANPKEVDKAVHEEFTKAGDEQGKVVSMNAKPGTLCQQAMSIMMSAYGCEVGSAAIKWIPIGGLFVTGGLTPKNIQYIDGKDTEFMKSYLNKGRVATVLDRIPLYAVMVEDLGVRGAHKAAMMEYERLYNTPHVHVKKSLVGQELQDYLWTALAVTAVVGFLAGNVCSKSFLKMK